MTPALHKEYPALAEFQKLPPAEQARIVSELQNELLHPAPQNSRTRPVGPDLPAGTPEAARQFIAQMHRLLWYTIEQGVRKILNREVPDVVRIAVRHELRRILQERNP